MLDSVEIEKGNPIAAVSSDASVTSGLIAGGVAVTDKLVLGTVYKLQRIEDAATYGLNAAYDTTNKVLVFYHISEFYRMFGPGATLYIMVLAQTVLPATALANQAKDMISLAKGEIRQLAIAFNPVSGYTETLTDGFNSDVRAAIQPAQVFAEWCYETDRPLNVLLEARSFTSTPGSAIDLRAIAAGSEILKADRVSLIIGQDYDFAETLDALGKKHAAVGTALGTLASIKVNHNIGEVEFLNLSDAVRQKFLNAGLSSHVKVEAVEASLQSLSDKGYIFPVAYTGVTGYRWNDDPVCAPKIIDEVGNMNAHYISLGRTEDDAVRKLKSVLILKIKTVQPVAKTGKLPLGVVKFFNGLGNTVFADMQKAGLISNGETITDPNSDLLTGERALIVDFALQPTGTINKIKGTINLKKSI